MQESTEVPCAPARTRRGAELFAVALVLLAYAILIERCSSPYVGGSDSSAYYNGAKLLAAGKISTEVRALPGLPVGTDPVPNSDIYIPYGFRALGHNLIVSGYPPGLSLLMAATAKITGWEFGAGWTAGWHTFLGVLLMYALCRECGLSVPWARFGTAILATSPLYLSMGLQPMSDVPALVWCTAGVYFALLSRRRHAAWAAAGGFAVAMAVLIRPTNVLVFLPVAVCLGVSVRWIWLGLGGLPGAIFALLFNYHAYGAVFTTGYGDLSYAFQTQWIPETLVHYVKWLPMLFTPVVILAACLPWTKDVPSRTKWTLVVWTTSVLGFYCFYYFTHLVWWYLRFILPAMPAMIVAALLPMQAWARRKNSAFSPAAFGDWRTRLGPALLVLLALGTNYFWIQHLHALKGKHSDSAFLKVSEWFKANAPANSVIASGQASGALFCYTHFPILRWDIVNAEVMRKIEPRLNEAGSPLYAAMFPYEEKPALEENMPGKWEQLANIKGVTLWRRVATATP